MRVTIIVGIILIIGLAIWLSGKVNAIADSLTARIANAIASAEGFFVDGTRPARNHNPGDLRKDLNGRGTGTDDEGFIIYATDSDGWDALYKQVRLFFSGSMFYRPTMSIADVAQLYAPGAQAVNWAQTVSARLGVVPDTRLNELV